MFLFLKKAYPFERNLKKVVLTNLGIGVFIFLFLYIFQPFGIILWQTPFKILKLGGFGLISFFVPFLYQASTHIILYKFYDKDNWKVWKELLSNSFVLLLIALSNFLYIHFITDISLSVFGFVNAVVCVLVIGIFPIAISIFTKHNKFLKLNAQEAEKINTEIERIHKNDIPIVEVKSTVPEELTKNNEQQNTNLSKSLTLIAENEKDTFSIELTRLLYIESQDNYASIVFNEKGYLKRQLLRSSLKRIESQIQQPEILKCHRAYLVNILNVINIEGNAAGYKLSFPNIEEKIPVSRNYGKIILEALRKVPN